MSGSASRWKDLPERDRWRANSALEAGRPVDEDLVPAVLDLQRANKRGAVNLAWLAPLIVGPGTALLVALLDAGEREESFLSFASRVMVVTVPLMVTVFGAAAFWAYNAVDQRERRLREQIGEPVAERSPIARVGRTVGRAAFALLMGVFLTPVVMMPVRLALFLVSLLGVPVDAVPQEIGWAVGAIVLVLIATYSHRWLRTSPSSPLRSAERTP